MTELQTNQPIAWRTTTTDGLSTHFTENSRIAEQWSESGFDVTPLFILPTTPSPVENLVGGIPSIEESLRSQLAGLRRERNALEMIIAGKDIAFRKIADMIDAEDADLDDAISIAAAALTSEGQP